MENAAVGIGLLIGLITGAAAMLGMLSASKGELTTSKVSELGAYLLVIAASWFGGSWVSGAILSSVPWSVVLPYYVLGLLIGFVPLFGYTAWRLALKIGRDFGDS